MQANLEAVHEAAKLCVRHCLSLNRTVDVVGRTFVQFDQGELRRAVDGGHRQIKPIIGDLMQHAVATNLADGDRTVVAKCAHGLALQVAVRTLALLADGVPEGEIRWGMDPLLNLYGMLGTEFHAAATPPVAEPADVDHAPKSNATANAMMLEQLQENHEAAGWSLREWAAAVGRSKSTIQETPTWKMIEDQRLKAKAERALDRHRNGQRGHRSR